MSSSLTTYLPLGSTDWGDAGPASHPAPVQLLFCRIPCTDTPLHHPSVNLQPLNTLQHSQTLPQPQLRLFSQEFSTGGIPGYSIPCHKHTRASRRLLTSSLQLAPSFWGPGFTSRNSSLQLRQFICFPGCLAGDQLLLP